MSKKRFENRHFNRRQFLAGAGAMLALPPLISLMPEKLAAQILTSSRRRSVSCVGLFGVDPHQLFPTNHSDSQITLMSGEYSVAYKQLQNFGTNRISRMIDSDFISMYPKMNLYQGLGLSGGYGAGHNKGVLAGVHSGHRTPIYGKTIDVIMEQSSGVYASSDNVPHKAIRLHTNDHDRGFSFDRVNGEIVVSDAIQGDTNLFNTLFGAFQQPTADNSKKLIVDRVSEDLQSLQNNSRLSKYDKNILDRYIAGIHDLQKKLSTSAPSCQKLSLALEANSSGNYYHFPSEIKWGVENVAKMFDNYIEMIKLAFACDLTRVVHIGNLMWSDQPVGVSSDGGLHHEAGKSSTGAASSDVAADRQLWGLKRMLKLAQALDGMTDPFGGGTLLDNSLVFWTNELGAWTTSHSTLTMPAVSFGSCGGNFRTGYFVDYRQRPLKVINDPYVPYYPGRPYKQLLQTIMLSMGVPKSEYMKYGDGNGFGEFKVDIEKMKGIYTPYAAEHNDPLPFIFKG